ncbi:probable pectinesterase/pectinesterase inhibitor 51 [Mangifera indica]|uniref:probable pectinesterase/pectinesterase inhibitor 51 n=1 Tax=Mangifera indica TaxID=29780 RepID=UPI001CFB7E76|nr:probable pectinesterase/pectinesterase inhibitor 51 [Mangifera indica]
MPIKWPPKKPKSRFLILLFMASLLLTLSFFSLFLFFSLSSASHRNHLPKLIQPSEEIPQIALACKATRDPVTCQSSLSESKQVPANPTPSQMIQAAIWVSSENLKTAVVKVQSILDSSGGNQNRSNAAKNCLELLGYSEKRTQSANDALPRGKIKDARAWYSAALTYQYDSWSALKYVNDTKLVGETMSFLNSLMQLTSNALSMMMSFDNFGDDFNTWRAPETERTGFWEKDRSKAAHLGFNGGFPSDLTADVTVCKDGSCNYKTVQDAVNAAPENLATRRFVINIKAGVYEEIVRVAFEKKNVVFLGDGMGKTVISGSLNTGLMGITTFKTATVGVVGDGFMASGVTFQNTAGPDAHQAVAFRSDSDLSIVENCEFLSNQDTLYAHSLRQFYRNCRIQGNVDFIFGNSPAFFQDCQILVAPRQINPEKGENNAVTAQGRTDPAQSTGFVFQNCLINGTEDYIKLYLEKPKVHKTYLGRPWKEFSRTVLIHCTLEALIQPDGWMPFNGDFALKTLYYGEFENSGPGSDTSKRVPWSSHIPAEHVNTYSVQNFIQGNEWISTSS